MQRLGTGTITDGGDVDALVFDWGTVRILSEPQVTGAQQHSFGVVELSPGQGHERHNHPGSEETIFVVSGQGEQIIDDQPAVAIGPGTCIYVPDSVYHSTLNTGTETLHLVVVYAPTGPERVLREIPGCQIVVAGSIEEQAS